MITSVNLGSNGRLGNQLFQYAALRGLSLKNGYQIKIPNPNTMSWHGQKCLLNKFCITEDYLKDSDLQKIIHNYVEPDWKKIDNKFFELPDNTNINGYFQSMFYFEEFADQIRKELTPKSEFLKIEKDYIEKLKLEHKCEIVSVHVRRGDNMSNNQIGLIKAFEPEGIYQEYFQKAKEIFSNKKVKFLVFTGGKRGDEDNTEDLEWCKKFFSGDEFIFSENKDQIGDFCRIMCCDHNILSQASSFGWWASYLNTNETKITVAPEWYHPDEPSLKREKFYPKNFILK